MMNSIKIGKKLKSSIEKPEIDGTLWHQVVKQDDILMVFAAVTPNTDKSVTRPETQLVTSSLQREIVRVGGMRPTRTKNGSTMSVMRCTEMKEKLRSSEKELMRKSRKLNLTLFTPNILEPGLEKQLLELRSHEAKRGMPHVRRTSGQARSAS